jgi:hypothetical protein
MPHLRPSPRPSKKVQEDRATPSAPSRPKANKNDEKQQIGIMPPPPKPKKNDKKQQDGTVAAPAVNAEGKAFPSRDEMDARLAQRLGAEIDRNSAQALKAKKGVNGAHEAKLMLKLRNTTSSSSGSRQYVSEWKKEGEEAGEAEVLFESIELPYTLWERNEGQSGDDTEDAGDGEEEENLERDSAFVLVCLSRATEADGEVLDAARILMKMSGVSEI